jgi:TonB family protein
MADAPQQQGRAGRSERDSRTRQSHATGLIVIIGLALVFCLIVGLIIVSGGRKPRATTDGSPTLTVLPLRIRLRAEPQASAAVVTTANEGEVLTLLEDRGTWVRVSNPDGLSGWAERTGLERTAERERRMARYAAIRKLPPLDGTVSKGTPVYAGPGIFYPVVGDLSAQSHVKVYTRDHDFYAVETGSAVAYADVDAVDVSASGSRQLEVRSGEGTVAPTETTDTSAGLPTEPTETVASVPPPPPPPERAEEPPPAQPMAAAAPDRSGVYAAVPPEGTQPVEIDRAIPIYPVMARRVGAGGSAVIRGIVRRDGTIDEVEIVKNLPYGMGDAARDAVRRWRFRPATYRGEPIDVYYTVTVNFRLTP